VACFSGVIKSFSPNTGYGFIDCPQTRQIYGKDMFVMRSSLPNHSAEKGDQVTFSVVQEHNGPVATNVEIIGRAGGGFGGGPGPIGSFAVHDASKGFHGSIGSPAFRGGFAAAAPPPVQSSVPAGMTHSFVGVVKSFNPMKGWGMITCDVTEQLYGKDMFFSAAAVPGGQIQKGEPVRFSIRMEAKGPAAVEVTPARMGAAPQWQSPPPPPQLMQQPQQQYRLPPPQQPMFSPELAMQAPGGKMPSPQQVLLGTVKSFFEERGWGFITCEAATRAFAKDVFLTKQGLQGQDVVAGSLVSFKIAMSPKGPTAAEVSVLPQGSFGDAETQSRTFVANVKTFNEEKGWGFIAGQELFSIFGKDIFVHKRDLRGQAIGPGDEVQFSVEADKDSQPVAKNVAVLAQGPKSFGKDIRARPY